LHYYAIPEHGKKIEMPNVYQDMYNENYLAIKKRRLKIPSLYGTNEEHYIPLFTGGKQ